MAVPSADLEDVNVLYVAFKILKAKKTVLR